MSLPAGRTQEDRILRAMTGIVAELGYRKATVARVIKRAGVSRATFYELFDSRGACFEAAQARALKCLEAASEGAPRIDAALAELDDQHPGAFELIFNASPLAGPGPTERYLKALDRLTAAEPRPEVGAAITLRARRST